MNERSAGSSFPKFGRQWAVAVALLATLVLGTSMLEMSHPSQGADPPIPASAPPTPSEAAYAVPSASEVFSGQAAPQAGEPIPSF